MQLSLPTRGWQSEPRAGPAGRFTPLGRVRAVLRPPPLVLVPPPSCASRDSTAEESAVSSQTSQEKYVAVIAPRVFAFIPFVCVWCDGMAQSKRRKVPSLQSTCIQYAPPHPRWREAARSPVALLSSSGGGSMRSHHRRRPCRRSYACHSGNRHRNRMSTRHRRPPA